MKQSSRDNTDHRDRAQRLVDVAKKTAATAFPNPSRCGCPAQSVIHAMAFRDKKLKLSDIPATHVATCSPCFLEYTRQRAHAQTARTRQLVIAFAIGICVLLGTSLVFWRVTGTEELPTVARQPNAPSAEVPSIVPLQPKVRPGPPAMRVDLSRFSPIRGHDASSTQPIVLPPKWIRASFVMPVGSEPGRYDIRLLTANQDPVRETAVIATLQEGVTSFELEFHLETMPNASLVLMVRPNGLGWRTFPVLVDSQEKTNSPPMH